MDFEDIDAYNLIISVLTLWFWESFSTIWRSGSRPFAIVKSQKGMSSNMFSMLSTMTQTMCSRCMKPRHNTVNWMNSIRMRDKTIFWKMFSLRHSLTKLGQNNKWYLHCNGKVFKHQMLWVLFYKAHFIHWQMSVVSIGTAHCGTIWTNQHGIRRFWTLTRLMFVTLTMNLSSLCCWQWIRAACDVANEREL